ncbi:MAG: hypothetical protein JWR34_1084 [Mycobacterium sp.]|nr:hypothetical protein [Mycobacterium sp.]
MVFTPVGLIAVIAARPATAGEDWSELAEPSEVVAVQEIGCCTKRCGCRVGKAKEVIGAVTGPLISRSTDVVLVVVAVLSRGPLRLVGIFEQLQGKKIGLRTPE